MQASSQQQSQTAQKQAAQTSADSQVLVLCPKCGAEIPEDAPFCGECGAAAKQRICPNCGKGNTLTADICQYCKAWLLENQCKFCYAELSDDSSFCPECGKPREGIPCPHCGHLSIFGFCPKCGKPVTEEAVAELKAAQAEMPPAPVDPQIAEMEAELAKLEAVINAEPEPVIAYDDYEDAYDPDGYDEPDPVIEAEPERKPFFSSSQMASIRQTGSDIDAAQMQRAEEARIAEEKRKEAERIAEEKRREAARLAEEKRREAARLAEERRQAAEAKRIADEAERQRQIQQAQAQKAALQQKMEQDRIAAAAAREAAAIAQARQNAQKRFNNNQDARKWHLARRNPGAIGWLCNYSDTVHLYTDGGPDECADASKGGCDYFGEIYKEGDWWKPKQ
jgi:chemotaxis protein histidine kinase CheA